MRTLLGLVLLVACARGRSPMAGGDAATADRTAGNEAAVDTSAVDKPVQEAPRDPAFDARGTDAAAAAPDGAIAAAGMPCTGDAACGGRACVDGVCCESYCGFKCESCAVPGSLGQCVPIPAGLDPDDDCAGEDACGGTCNGKSACAFPPSGTPCGDPGGCEGGFMSRQECDGSGACYESFYRCTDYP